MYAEVAVDVPVYDTFTYRVPDELSDLQVGHLVRIPFRNRSKTGLVVQRSDHLEDDELRDKLKPVLDRVAPDPLLNETGVRFLEFIADYYFAPIGHVVRLALPASVRVEGLKHYAPVEDAPRADAPDDDLARALEEVRKAGPLSIEALRDRTPVDTYSELAKLEEHELVEVVYREDDRGPGTKEETYYSIAAEPDEGDRIGSKQAELLEILQQRSPEAVPLSDLRAAVDDPYSSLRGLEKRGFLESHTEEVYRDPFEDAPVPAPPDHDLTSDQAAALEEIRGAASEGGYEGFVLHGVTGSGKTEVYARAGRDCLDRGERALLLLPEIALTPQFVGVFRARFQGDATIAVLHSGLTPAERFDEWRRIERDEVDIVIGARSALFAPLSDLGLVVVDEEHDTSFKQESGPRYNARDMALVRGKLEGARVILGGATPSLESYHNAKTGRLSYLPMPDRVEQQPLPDVEIVDMRSEEQANADDEESGILSARLAGAIRRTLDDGQQAILFLNRRGFSPCVLCDGCGEVFECPDCDVSLTYHRQREALRCHHCDYSVRMPESCPNCGDSGLAKRGIGTEQLEGRLEERYPDANVARLDRDTVGGEGMRRMLRRFRHGEIDILAGTQMVTKGHDFPGVVTVGVVLADLSLNFPDFRSAERTFQLLTQVSGRAGRGEEPGRVYVQTYNPDHYSVQAASEHDYESFADRELELRKRQNYPPHGHLVAIKFASENDSQVKRAARTYASAARAVVQHADALQDRVMMLGPAMAPLSQL
ncbi:MAG: primosomal protein N', partial [Bradymonadaceae bacterium]